MIRSVNVSKAIDKIWKSYNKNQIQEGYAQLRRAAKEGDADACCFLARCHLGEEYIWNGAEIPVDRAYASRLLKESIQLGSAEGVLCAMRTGIWSEDLEKKMPFSSLKEVFEIVLQQAKEGDGFSMYEIGNAMFYGDYLIIFSEENDKYENAEDYYEFAYPIAAKYYEDSFKTGLAAGFGNYRTIYESDYAEITEEMLEDVMLNFVNAENPLVCNDYGKWLEDEYGDEEKAFSFYLKAVELGDKCSAYNVAVCYATGTGVEENLDKAFDYYLLAADAGHAKAQFQLGNFYFEGRGSVKQDFAKALPWLLKAYDNMEEEDSWQAAAELAVCYQSGHGVKQDYNTAFRYLSLIEQEEMLDELWEPVDAMVLNALGVAYGFGYGAPQDIPRAIDYFDRAIEFDSEDARRNKACFKKTLFGGWKLK